MQSERTRTPLRVTPPSRGKPPRSRALAQAGQFRARSITDSSSPSVALRATPPQLRWGGRDDDSSSPSVALRATPPQLRWGGRDDDSSSPSVALRATPPQLRWGGRDD